jgi:competence protein ComEC
MSGDGLDLRLAPVALTAWLVAVVAIGWPTPVGLAGAGILLAAGGAAGVVGRAPWAAAILFVAAAAMAVAVLRGGAVRLGPIPDLAAQRAEVEVVGRIASDPITRDGRFEPYVVMRMVVTRAAGRGQIASMRTPVLVIGDQSWSNLRLGATVAASGRLAPATTPDVAAVLYADRVVTPLSPPSWVWTGVGAVRRGVREAASSAAEPERSLVPALVDGEETSGLDALADDFAATGLTHLLAVSGSNLTLVLAFTLLIARLVGVRGRGLTVVAVVAVAFFVLLARPEPSVLRAAAMGLVGLAGLSAGGRTRGIRALCAAVVVLVLLDPWLARAPGFVLSVAATAGILVFGASWRDALATWIPRLLAEAIAVPLAAQLACTPVIAAISGQVSVVAVAANVVAAPAVGPATVLGLIGGLVELASSGVGHVIGLVAAVPAWWIVTVARTAAGLRGATLGFPANAAAIALLAVACAAVGATLRVVLVRRTACLAAAGAMVLAALQPWGRLGWPPDDWLLVMCDVGQGDALVLHAADRAAVVVDAGPDPRLVDRCLDDLDVSTVPLVVLTHFHADHVDGLPGVLDGRAVGAIEVSPLAEPRSGAAEVADWAAAAGVPVTAATLGESWRVGALRWDVLGPTSATARPPSSDDEAEGSVPNNASIVMRVAVGGFTLLLAGDAEPEEEDAILDTGAALGADVVKVSHHGSESQDPAFYEQTGARVALISVGAGNDYGHPAPATVLLMEGLGMQVYRTDLDGSIAVVERDGDLAVVAGG